MAGDRDPPGELTRPAFASDALRLSVLGALLLLQQLTGEPFAPGGAPPAFFAGLGAYAAVALAGWLAERGLGRPLAGWRLLGDTAFVMGLSWLTGGVRSGAAILMFPYLALVAPWLRPRLLLFHAALASLAILGETAWRVLSGLSAEDELMPTGFLALGYFAVVLAAGRLAGAARRFETLAAARAEALAGQARLNDLLLSTLDAAAIAVDDAGRVLQLNARAGQWWPELRRGTVWPAAAALLARHPPAGLPDAGRPLEFSAGARRCTGRLAPMPAGGRAGAMLFLRDAAQVESDAHTIKLAAMGRLTASIAHEIRNPLAAVAQAAELLADTPRAAQDARLLAIVRDNAARIDRLIDDVLGAHRRDRLQPEHLMLARFLPAFVDEFVLATPAVAGRIRLDIAAGAAIEFDRGHLGQILSNLLANACRHGSGQPGSVVLTVLCERAAVIIDVRDDGPGVPPEQQARLFEPFWTTSPRGSGLGLYVAREVAAANRATLDYLPPGGHFRLRVPVQP